MKLLLIFSLAYLLLAGCSGEGGAIVEPTLQPIQIREGDSDELTSQGKWPDGEEKLDAQGAVEVSVIPLNLNNPDGSLNFEVKLDTHSVDLSMDLASLAMLEADNGLHVGAMGWDAAVGGHHVEGVLSFPTDLDGSALLDNASSLTLIIRDVDASVRVFSWIAAK